MVFYSSGLWKPSGLLVLQVVLKNLPLGGCSKCNYKKDALFFTSLEGVG